jgi:hypothetical protein
MPTYAAPIAAPVAAPQHFGAISVSAACVVLTLALLLKWRPLNRLEFLIPWLCLIAGIGFAAAFLRSWAHNLAGFGSSFVPVVGVAAPVIVAIVLLFIVCYDLWPRHRTNTTTAVAALLLPAFGPEIGGTVGVFLGTALSSIAVFGARAIATLFGV